MFQILKQIGGFNLSQEEQAKVNTDWVSKIYPYVGIGNVANLTANPYFAIIDPYKHYRSTMPTPEVPVNEMKKREKDVLAYSVMGEKTIYEARAAEIYENILKKYEVNLYSEVDRLQGISVHNLKNTDKVVILEFTPTTANEMVGVKVCDRPGRLVSTDMSERVQGLLDRCAGWSRESHTSDEFENMRGALEALQNITLIDNPSTEDIKAANAAFTHLKNMTNAYLIRKQTYHNGTKYEKARIKFAKDVMAFANEKLAQLDYCGKHIKTVSARQQQAENNQPPQGENINGNDPQVEIDGEKLYNELMKKCSIEQIQEWLDKFRIYKELDEESKEKFISLGNNYINCLKGVHNSLTENNFQALYTAEQSFYNAFTEDDKIFEVMQEDFSGEVGVFNAHDDFMRELAKPNAFKEAALAARLNPEKKPEVKAEPVDAQKNENDNEPLKQEENNEPPKDEVKAEPVDAQKNENDNEPLKQEENNEPPKDEVKAEPVDAQKNENDNEPLKQEENNEPPKDEVKAEPVDAQKNENDNEPDNGEPDYDDAWADAEIYARMQVREFMATKKAYSLSDLTRKALAGYVIRELISSEQDEPNTEPLVTQLVNKGKMNVLVDKIINSKPFNSQLKQVLTNFGTAKKFFENIPSNLKGSPKDHWKNPSKIMERNMCLKAGTQFLAEFKKELELEKQKKPEVKKEQSVNASKNEVKAEPKLQAQAPIAKNKDADKAFGTLTQGLAGASKDSAAAKKKIEQEISGNDVFFNMFMRAIDNGGRTPTGAKVTQEHKDMILEAVRKNTALRAVSELVSAEQKKQKQSPKAAVQVPVTQIVNAGKANQLADLIADSDAFDRVFQGCFIYYNIKELLSLGNSGVFRAMCAEAGQEFLNTIAITKQEKCARKERQRAAEAGQGKVNSVF